MSRSSRRTQNDPLVVSGAGPDPGQSVTSAPSAAFSRQSIGKTDTGVAREQNEDAFFVDDASGLYLVCDGMGGHASGQLASEIAITTVVETMISGRDLDGGEEPLSVALKRANQAILTQAGENPSNRGMGTTAVGIRAEDDLVHICHCGDSRCYLLRGGHLQQVTEDHSLQNLYKNKPELAGQLGPAESNVIVRAIGLDPNVEIDHRVMAMEDGDLFLLCCDGLTDLVEDWMIQEIVTSDEHLDAMASNLIRAANANGGTDNITVILLRLRADSSGYSESGPDDGTLPGY